MLSEFQVKKNKQVHIQMRLRLLRKETEEERDRLEELTSRRLKGVATEIIELIKRDRELLEEGEKILMHQQKSFFFSSFVFAKITFPQGLSENEKKLEEIRLKPNPNSKDLENILKLEGKVESGRIALHAQEVGNIISISRFHSTLSITLCFSKYRLADLVTVSSFLFFLR